MGTQDLRHYRWGRPEHPALLLVHGLTEAGTAWPDAVRRWQDAYSVEAIDLRGHGRSARFDDEQLRRCAEVWTSDLLGVLRRQERPPVVVAHSLGGLLALRAAVAAPSLVRGLVLEDPARPTGDPVPDPGHVAEIEGFLDGFAGGVDPEIARMSAETSWSAAEIEAWAECKPLVDRRMIRDGLVLGPAGWEEVFARLSVPTLVVVPRDGEMTPDERAFTNPLVRVHRVDGVGHCVRRDDPDAYHAVVDPFLESLDDG